MSLFRSCFTKLIPKANVPASSTKTFRCSATCPTDQFNLFMASITEWVSPEQGCAYCHNEENLASDELYTPRLSRAA
jgi:photosynthetic reaction center cytochrome c subunit